MRTHTVRQPIVPDGIDVHLGHLHAILVSPLHAGYGFEEVLREQETVRGGMGSNVRLIS